MATYEITKTAPQMYIDEAGQVVQGYRIHYRNVEFNEADFVDVPNKAETTVKFAIEKEVTDRKKISMLGK